MAPVHSLFKSWFLLGRKLPRQGVELNEWKLVLDGKIEAFVVIPDDIDTDKQLREFFENTRKAVDNIVIASKVVFYDNSVETFFTEDLTFFARAVQNVLLSLAFEMEHSQQEL